MKILPGFDSYHKNDRWLPLRIILSSTDENMTGEITVELQDSSKRSRQVYSAPVSLFNNTTKVQYLYVLPESFRRNLNVRLLDNHAKEVLQKDTSLVVIPPEDLLIVVVASNNGGLEFLTGKRDETAAINVSYSTAEFLPDKWKGYDSVDVIVLGDISISRLSAYQRSAITDWVYDGGNLVVSGGIYSQNLIGTFIERLLPVRINGTRVLNSIDSLSQQFGADIKGKLIVTASSELANNGRIITAESDGLPIIAEKEVGYGKIIFLAFDYLDPAIRSWEGKRRMWESLLNGPKPRQSPGNNDIPRIISSIGLVIPFSYEFVGLLLFLYILCFGPLNYLILKRFNRVEWSWVTMPAVAAAFTLGSLGFVYTTKIQAPMVNDLSVVDIYQDAGRASVTSYFGLCSPAERDYTMQFPASKVIFVNQMRDSEVNQDSDCRFIERDTFQMEVLRVKALSPSLFFGESYVDLDGSISINPSGSPEGFIRGKVTSNLPFDLSECYVFSGGRHAYIGDLARGDTLNLTQSEYLPGLYSTKGSEKQTNFGILKQRFFNAMRQSLSSNITGTGMLGWADESALKTIVEMKMQEGYKVQGAALVIVHVKT